MAVLTDKMWHGEPLRATIKFGENLDYTVYTDNSYAPQAQQDSMNLLKQIDFSLSQGNARVNPLGIAVSNSISMQIYDADDSLSPINLNSPYYGKVVNGIEIDIEISYDGVTWDKYGVYFATNWSGNYEEGAHGFTSVSAEDRITTLGNEDLPELPVTQNLPAVDLIDAVMQGLGLTKNTDYSIDSQLDETVSYGIVQGGKVRDALNNICQLLFARVIVSRTGMIRFVPALSPYDGCNEIVLTETDTGGQLSNHNTSNINYNKVVVHYLEEGEASRQVLFSDNSHVLADGTNQINDIKFRFKAMSVEQVQVLFDDTPAHALISDIKFRAFQSGINLTIEVEDGPIPSCVITGEGLTVSTYRKELSADIGGSSVKGGLVYNFDTQQMMTTAQAQSLLTSLVSYIQAISKNIGMSGAVLTPKLYVGDKVTIQGTDTIYDGDYKITDMNISFGENYEMDFNMIRIPEEEEEEA